MSNEKRKKRRTWNLLRTIDLEQWAGVGILVWVPKRRTIYAAYLDASGVLRAWLQGNGPDDVIEGATQWRRMPAGPLYTKRSRSRHDR